MTDELKDTGSSTLDDVNAKTEADDQTEEPSGEEKKERLNQNVLIHDVGPCRKRINVIINRGDIDKRLNEKFKEIAPEAQIPGYRPGKVPRKLLQKHYFKEVSDQIKAELVLQSLEQLAEDHKLTPIAQPNIDPFKIQLPDAGDLTYEFEVEVAPEFELPQYKGLTLKRPVKDITDADVDDAFKKFLRRMGTLIPKDGPVELEDYIECDMTIRHEDKVINEFKDLVLRVEPQLAFKDGMAEAFGEKIKGAKAGDERDISVQLSPSLMDDALRGKLVQGRVLVKNVKQIQLPELNSDFFSMMGVEAEEELRDRVRSALEQQLEHAQRQSAREQVLGHIAEVSTWDLPHDLLHRQARRTLQRRVFELRNAGYSEEDVRKQITILQQDSLATTAKALKEHFVLQKIAEVENIDVNDDDIQEEIESIAERSDESPRKVRARLEREDMMESLVMEILERKALDLVLEHATYEDVPMASAGPKLEAIEASASGVEETPPPPVTPPTEE